MFTQPEPLSPDRHARLGLAREPDYSAASGEMVTPIFSGEAWQIAREYVMVFPVEDSALPLALLGYQQGINAYVGKRPAWWGRYVPAHIRRYPFVAAPRQSDDGQQHFTVMIDIVAPQLIEGGGQPLFTSEGQPSPLLNEVQRVLTNLQKDANRTSLLVKQIADTGLLIEQSLQIKVQGGEALGLQGFRIIDRDAFRQCDGETLAALNKTGALDLIQAHFCSLTNLQDGLIAKKAAGKIDQTGLPDGPASLEELFNEGDDDFTFDFDS